MKYYVFHNRVRVVHSYRAQRACANKGSASGRPLCARDRPPPRGPRENDNFYRLGTRQICVSFGFAKRNENLLIFVKREISW